MTAKYTSYSPSEMHEILKEYQPNVKGSGFKALATKFNVKGGAKLIRLWFRKWDGTENSLEKISGGDHRSILTEKEQKKHISKFIDKASDIEAVTYPQVVKNVERKTKKKPSLRTVQRIGKKFKFTSKKRKRVLESEGILCMLLCLFVYVSNLEISF
jgi:transposase